MDITDDDFGTLAVCALRYCQGRETYMPGLVRRIVKAHLSEVCDKDLRVMIQDCDYQATMGLWGDESIDKPGWVQWKEDLLAEQKRREETCL